MIIYTCKLVKGVAHEVLRLNNDTTKLVIVGNINKPELRTEDVLFRGVRGEEANNIQGQEVVFSEIREIFVGSRVAQRSNVTQELEVIGSGNNMGPYRVKGLPLEDAFFRYEGKNTK